MTSFRGWPGLFFGIQLDCRLLVGYLRCLGDGLTPFHVIAYHGHTIAFFAVTR
jgi:hypothetical protein